MEREKLVTLVSAAQSGSEKAFSDLFNYYYKDVYYFALKNCQNEDIACDITQETFIEIINTLGKLREPAAFVTWMKRIAYHQYTDYYKKQGVREKHESPISENEDGVSILDFLEEDKQDFIPDQALDQQELRKILLDFLDQLSPDLRSAMILYYYDELPISEIAQIQQVSINTVSGRLRYGRKAMATLVTDYEKKSGIKLRSVGLFPLFLWLYGRETAAVGGTVIAGIAGGVTAATGTAITVTTGTAAATGLTAFFASIPIAVKITAAAAAAIAVAVGITATSVSPKTPSAPTETTVVTTYTVPEETVPPETSPTEPVPTEIVPVETTIAETMPVDADPSIAGGIVPEGCTYILADGTVIHPGSTMPQSCTQEDRFVTPDYTYTYEKNDFATGWDCKVNDKTKTAYPLLLRRINGADLVYLRLTFDDCSQMTAAPTIPDGVISLFGTFSGCSKLQSSPVIPFGVTNMDYTFQNCISLTEPPMLPDGLTSLEYTFSDCTSLKTAPVIPQGVTSIAGIFSGCTSLETAPVIPEGVTDMNNAFNGCRLLDTAPTLPSTVTNLSYTFSECPALVEAPEIPDSVTSMNRTFTGCTALISAPVIPEGVNALESCFMFCTALTGEITIHATPQFYDLCFHGTTLPIVLTGNGSNLPELAETGNNGNVSVKTSLEETVPEETSPEETVPEETPPEETVPEQTGYVVPEGCTYEQQKNNTSYQAGEVVSQCLDNDTLLTKDFFYTYSAANGGWKANVFSRGKSSYEPFLAEINGFPLVSLDYTFWGCSNMITSPEIPDSVVSMYMTYRECSAMTTPPELPPNITELRETFLECTSLTTAPALPAGIKSLPYTFSYCSSLKQAPKLPYGVTSLSHTFNKCTSLTTAPLIPDSVTEMAPLNTVQPSPRHLFCPKA